MWLCIRLLAAVVVFGTTLPVDSSPRNKRQDDRQNDCSVGEVDKVLNEEDRLEAGGIYFLPEPVNCNGTLVSWHSCFFYSNLQPDADEYRMSLRVYRRDGDMYRFSRGRETSISISRPQDGNDTTSCIDEPLDNPIVVLVGDRIGLQVDLDCRRNEQICPLHPNLNRSGASPVFHLLGINGRGDIDVSLVENETYYTNVIINVRVSIEMNPQASSKHHGLSRGGIAGVVVGSTLFVVLIFIVVHLLLKLRTCRRSQTKKSTYLSVHTRDPRFGGHYHAYAESTVEHSYEDPDDLSNKQLGSNSTASSYRERFQNRMYSQSNTYSLLGEDTQEDETVQVDDENSGHYEVYESDPYWEPANLEDELRQQLSQLHIAEVPTEELKLDEHLGSGQFGTVTKGVWQHSESETEVAVKILKCGSTEDERVKFLQEAAIMGQFKHPNIIKIHGVVTIAEPLMIICELMHKGDLHHCLLSITPSYGDSDLPAMLLSFCRQVAAGMSYLAQKSFVHRDLAARNILVSKDDVCKIADFGLSRDLQNEDFYISHGGKIPVKWTAPEALNFRKYSTASDVWSYGILLYEIWALGRKPYHDSTNKDVLQNISSGYRLPPPSGCPKAVYQLMLQCWHPEAESRPTFYDILLVLQRPDFQLLKWKPEDEAAYSQEARTLGSVAEAGKELYADLQHMYSTPTDTA